MNIEGLLNRKHNRQQTILISFSQGIPDFFMSMDNRVLRLIIFLHWEKEFVGLILILKRYFDELN